MTFSHHFHGDVDRRLLFASHRFGARFRHADGFLRMHDAHSRISEIESLPCALDLQLALVADEIKVLKLRVISQRINRAADIHGGRMIPTHGV